MWKFIKKCFKPAETELSRGHIESKLTSIDVPEHSVVIVAPIDHLSYEIYGAQWNVDQKEQMQTLLPAFIQNYPKIFDHQNIKKVLEPYLMNSSS